MDDGWETTGGRRRGIRSRVLLVGIAAVVAATYGVAQLTNGSTRTTTPQTPVLEVQHDGQATTPPDGDDVASEPDEVLPRQRWQVAAAAPSPLQPSAAPRAAWTGEQLLALGLGSRAVAAYEPSLDRWRSLPSAPSDVPYREGPDVLWTGTELLVWGGRTHVFHRQIALGTALDPVSRTWRVIAPAPIEPRVRAAVVWTGEDLVVWGGRVDDPAGTPGPGPAGAAYTPGTDTWRPLAPAPVPDDVPVQGMAIDGTVVVWGGDEVGLPRTEEPFAARYDPAQDEWTVLPPPPLDAPARAHAVWTGSALLVWGRRTLAGDHPGGVAFDPIDGRWEPMAPVPPSAQDLPRNAGASAVVWADGQMVAFGDRVTPFALAWDDVGDRWAQPSPAPPPRADPVLAWTGQEVLVWGGHDGSGPLASIIRWRPG